MYKESFFMSTIYMARHGQASFGQDNYDQLSEKAAVSRRSWRIPDPDRLIL